MRRKRSRGGGGECDWMCTEFESWSFLSLTSPRFHYCCHFIDRFTLSRHQLSDCLWTIVCPLTRCCYNKALEKPLSSFFCSFLCDDNCNKRCIARRAASRLLIRLATSQSVMQRPSPFDGWYRKESITWECYCTTQTTWHLFIKESSRRREMHDQEKMEELHVRILLNIRISTYLLTEFLFLTVWTRVIF